MSTNELEMFLNAWDREAESTLKLMRALPPTQYDFRPDPSGRSLGELAWHLAEGDAYMSFGIETGRLGWMRSRPTLSAHAPLKRLWGYERIQGSGGEDFEAAAGGSGSFGSVFRAIR
jgi:hypothetical protein